MKSKQVIEIRASMLKIVDVLDTIVKDLQRAEARDGYSTPIEDLDFTVRTYNILKRARVDTVRELLGWSWPDIRDLRNAGDKTVTEIIEALDELGLHLYGDVACTPTCTLPEHQDPKQAFS